MYEMNGVRGKLMSNDRGSHLMLVELSTGVLAHYTKKIWENALFMSIRTFC